MQKERNAASGKVMHLESDISELQHTVNRINASARPANKENSAAGSEVEAQVRPLSEGRMWA
eukprot:3149601-Pleurochrysis_carterae.AAC.1